MLFNNLLAKSVFLDETLPSDVSNPIGKLIALFMGLATGYGVIILIRNGIDFFGALPERDTQTMKQAGLGMLGGFCTASLGAVLTYLGIKW